MSSLPAKCSRFRRVRVGTIGGTKVAGLEPPAGTMLCRDGPLRPRRGIPACAHNGHDLGGSTRLSVVVGLVVVSGCDVAR
jgi:hypothetical protein